jgi:hypothetical protein
LIRVGIQDIYCIANQQYIKHPYQIEDERFHRKLLEIIGNGIVP